MAIYPIDSLETWTNKSPRRNKGGCCNLWWIMVRHSVSLMKQLWKAQVSLEKQGFSYMCVNMVPSLA